MRCLQEPEDYNGGRKSKAFASFLKKKVSGSVALSCSDRVKSKFEGDSACKQL
jgi:hypothetical protein